MGYPYISIGIPSFNRPKELLERVRELLPQLTDDVELLISDNASDEVLETVVRREFGAELAGKHIRFHRNVTNLGLSANLCRCFELAEGKWLWLLGDDDSVKHDAVSTIISKIRSVENKISFVNFSTPFNRIVKDLEIGTMEELSKISREGRYFVSNIVYLSVGCYRMEVFRHFLRQGINMAASHCPHFAMILTMMIKGDHRILFTSEMPVLWNESTSGRDWSVLKLMAGSSTLVEIDGATEEAYQVVQKLVGEFQLPKYFRAMILLMFGDLRRPWRFWALFLSRMVVMAGWDLKLKSMMLLAVLPLVMNVHSRKFINRLLKNRNGTDSTWGENRL